MEFELEFELEYVHLLVLACTAAVILFADHEGFSYLRGKKQILSITHVRFFHRAVWVGLSLMILTGLLLALPRWERLIDKPEFLLKMFFVLVLVVNGIFIGKLMPIAAERPFAKLTAREKTFLCISGMASTAGWVGAGVIGYFFL